MKLYDDMINTYVYMAAHATEEVYTGSTVQALAEAGGTKAHYSKVFHYLSEMGCIVRLNRGARNTDSVVRLIHAPSEEDFREAYRKPLTKPKSNAKLQKDLETLERRLPRIDLAGWITATETRIKELEDRVEFLSPYEEE